MATVTITLTDMPDGNVRVQLVSEPQPKGGPETFTMAQAIGRGAVGFVIETLQEAAAVKVFDLTNAEKV